MTEKDIKPIPKYIVNIIKRYDKKYYPSQDGKLRFYAYLAMWKKELVKVTVAVKCKKKSWYIKQVAIHGLDSEKCLVKDMEYCGLIGYGYRVGWYEEGLQKSPYWYESKNWCFAKDKYYDPYVPIVNLEFIDKLPEFKYSQYETYLGYDILNYLRLYRKYPKIEYFMKLGLQSLVNSKMILNLAEKDIRFCKWLVKNKDTLISNKYYTKAIIKAYKKGTTLHYEQENEKILLENKRGIYYQFKQVYMYDFNKLIDYVIKQNTNMSNYIDYYNACEYLGLDLGQEKNRLPHNFKYWHDMRIEQYYTQKALSDEIKRKELYKQFELVVDKYIGLEKLRKGSYLIVLAKSPADLKIEGETLHHCVGSMNYDQKFIREESLIFFIREKENPNTPFVTMEYSIEKKSVLQCYGEHNTTPCEEVLTFINKIWLPYAKRQTKKLQNVA